MFNINVCITSNAVKNEDLEHSKWLNLPMDSEDLLTEINRYTQNDLFECCICDYESKFEISLDENLIKLNEFLNDIKSLKLSLPDDLIPLLIKHIREYDRSDYDELFFKLKDQDFQWIGPGITTYEELASKMDEEQLPFNYTLLKESGAISFIDWVKVGDHLKHNRWLIDSGYAIIIY